MLNWLKGLFGAKKADEGQAVSAPETKAPETSSAPAEDLTGAEEATQTSEEVK